ncbi:MAG TPA: hypothetical protein VIK52_04090 [Opitutaceae bacterium]
MNSTIRLVCALQICAATAIAQPLTPDLAQFADSSVWSIQDRTASKVPGHPSAMRLDARRGEGVAWLIGSDFAEGTFEVDLRGANVPGRSFVGVAFRGADDSHYDAIYFRAFNFMSPEKVRRSRAVQYVSMPEHTWQALREKHPGKYEAAINPVPDPDDWFHARIVVADRTIRVFVNDSEEPCLTVSELSDRLDGRVGLWVGDGSGGDFARFTITSREKP